MSRARKLLLAPLTQILAGPELPKARRKLGMIDINEPYLNDDREQTQR